MYILIFIQIHIILYCCGVIAYYSTLLTGLFLLRTPGGNRHRLEKLQRHDYPKTYKNAMNTRRMNNEGLRSKTNNIFETLRFSLLFISNSYYFVSFLYVSLLWNLPWIYYFVCALWNVTILSTFLLYHSMKLRLWFIEKQVYWIDCIVVMCYVVSHKYCIIFII